MISAAARTRGTRVLACASAKQSSGASVGRAAPAPTPVTAVKSAKGMFGGSRRAVMLGGLALGIAPWSGTASAASKADPFAEILEDPKWPEEFPFEAEKFQRYDESSDGLFYDQPRFVAHIDDRAIGQITKYYEKNLPKGDGVAVLDMCSSWISHYPKGYSAEMVVGMGMNGEELARNTVLTEYKVKDLNEDPTIPYPDNTFDAITNVVSVDYLTQPLKIFEEMHRVLKPGGVAIMSFSNRCFPTKAISIWTQTGDLDHVWIVGSYFHYSVPGGFTAPEGKDISPPPRSANPFTTPTDPMYVVTAKKA